MDARFEIALADIFPANAQEARRLLDERAESAFLVENPVSATLAVAGTADESRARLVETYRTTSRRAVLRALALHDAWLSFYRGNIDEAREAAVRLLEDPALQEGALPASDETAPAATAQRLGASFLVCCLARYGIERHLIDNALSFMSNLIAQRGPLSQAADICLGMHEMSIGIVSEVPAWIRMGSFRVYRVEDRLVFCDGGVYPENLYAAVIAAVQYANYRGDYEGSLAFIDLAEKVYGMHGYVVGDLYLSLYRAVNYQSLGFSGEAETYIRQAAHLAAPDGLWQPLSEFAPWFGDRFLHIVEGVSPAGAARCEDLAEGFIDRVKTSHREEAEIRGHVRLTPQELAVMQLANEGRKIAEIAAELHIEPVTVKFHKRNAYRKLGADAQTNLEDALRRNELSASWIETYPPV